MPTSHLAGIARLTSQASECRASTVRFLTIVWRQWDGSTGVRGQGHDWRVKSVHYRTAAFLPTACRWTVTAQPLAVPGRATTDRCQNNHPVAVRFELCLKTSAAAAWHVKIRLPPNYKCRRAAMCRVCCGILGYMIRV